ncbi:acyl-CoA-binding domain-containing protein 6-like [Uranotaenia lowii]|uniref:acyl-CoA-binding domain-containing protein 6-like n=1 Tax=Uranotaenia lowii TaxID=190385 RepID=UPI0024794862|nr:acyl-CoA-binding domain-containing protein 6-like [Uranotaenia lowii]
MSDFEEDPELDLLEEEFSRATKYIERNHGQLDQANLLRFYGLFKQSTAGKCTTQKPGIFNMSGRAKWSAWNDLGEMSQQQAMKGYIALLNELQSGWDSSDQVGDGEHKSNNQSWVSVSTFLPEDDPLEAGKEKTIVDFIKQGNRDQVEKILSGQEICSVINALDEEELGLIHWAADRGNVEVLTLILTVPQLDINLRDGGGQTALHYASSCGNRDCVKLLLDKGADRNAKDDEGETPLDIAFDSEIERLLK